MFNEENEKYSSGIKLFYSVTGASSLASGILNLSLISTASEDTYLYITSPLFIYLGLEFAVASAKNKIFPIVRYLSSKILKRKI